MSRPVICQGCREKFVRVEGNFVKDAKGFYHKKCYENAQKSKDRNLSLRDYILKLHNGKVNFGLVMKQIKDYTSNYNYTESGIMGTLYYCYEIKRMPISKANGIGIVPYYYNEARRYFEIQERVKGQKVFEYKDVVVKIDPPARKSKAFQQVDLDKILED